MPDPPPPTLAQLDHAHVWHPFTPMRQWCEKPPLVIEAGDGPYLIDTDGRRYLDGVSSLWCNVHGHRVPELDQAIRDQLDKIAHTTLLGLASPPSIALAARLVGLARRNLCPCRSDSATCSASPCGALNKVFYSDAGATALEVAFKMAVGHWHHRGYPRKHRFIGLSGAYHGDTVGTMSVGYSDLFHRAFQSMVFPVDWFPTPDAVRPPAPGNAPGNTTGNTTGKITGLFNSTGRSCDLAENAWPSEDPVLAEALSDYCLGELERMLEERAEETAAIVIEPVMQGAAGMVCQPAGFMGRVAALAKRFEVLLIADEVAVGFGRTGTMFACEHDRVSPDILCLAKGLTAGYLPLAVTMTTDAIYDAFTGEPDEKKTLYHGHTYTGNPLACAVALASLDLFDQPPAESDYPNLLEHINASAALIRQHLEPLRNCPHVRDIRQRGIMVGIELAPPRHPDHPSASGQDSGGDAFDFSKPQGHRFCDALRDQGIIIRPLGDVLVLMPIPATPHPVLAGLVDTVVAALRHDAPVAHP